MKFANASGASDRGGDSNCSNRRAAASLGYLKKNRAVGKSHFPRAFVETENRVGAEASDGQIRESQFAARLCAGANSIATANKIADHGRPRGPLFAQHLTSFTTWVTRASCNCAPRAEVAMAIVQIKADATAMNFVCGVPANSFFILAGILIHKKQHRCRLI